MVRDRIWNFSFSSNDLVAIDNVHAEQRSQSMTNVDIRYELRRFRPWRLGYELQKIEEWSSLLGRSQSEMSNFFF